MHNYSFNMTAHKDDLGGMENLMKGIEQELNHVFHTIGSENGARDTGEGPWRLDSNLWG